MSMLIRSSWEWLAAQVKSFMQKLSVYKNPWPIIMSIIKSRTWRARFDPKNSISSSHRPWICPPWKLSWTSTRTGGISGTPKNTWLPPRWGEYQSLICPSGNAFTSAQPKTTSCLPPIMIWWQLLIGMFFRPASMKNSSQPQPTWNKRQARNKRLSNYPILSRRRITTSISNWKNQRRINTLPRQVLRWWKKLSSNYLSFMERK